MYITFNPDNWLSWVVVRNWTEENEYWGDYSEGKGWSPHICFLAESALQETVWDLSGIFKGLSYVKIINPLSVLFLANIFPRF